MWSVLYFRFFFFPGTLIKRLMLCGFFANNWCLEMGLVLNPFGPLSIVIVFGMGGSECTGSPHFSCSLRCVSGGGPWKFHFYLTRYHIIVFIDLGVLQASGAGQLMEWYIHCYLRSGPGNFFSCFYLIILSYGMMLLYLCYPLPPGGFVLSYACYSLFNIITSYWWKN